MVQEYREAEQVSRLIETAGVVVGSEQALCRVGALENCS